MTGRGKSPAHPGRVVTAARFVAPPAVVWDGLMFYEQVTPRPPLILRLLLPAPRRAEGRKSELGDEIRCLYEEGRLVKRIVSIDPLGHCRFEIIQQQLRIAGGIRLVGGGYALAELPDGSTRVDLETRYLSPRRPRWLFHPIEAAVCHAFHRYILGAMRCAVESRRAPVAASRRATAIPSP